MTDLLERWCGALHEVGHLVAGKVLFGVGGSAVLFTRGAAFCLSSETCGANHVNAAIVAEAGERAVLLADRWPCPEITLPTIAAPCELPELPIGTADEQARAEAVRTDREHVFSLYHRLDLPHDLQGLWLRFVQQMADAIIEQHELEIVALAHELFRVGRLVV